MRRSRLTGSLPSRMIYDTTVELCLRNFEQGGVLALATYLKFLNKNPDMMPKPKNLNPSAENPIF